MNEVFRHAYKANEYAKYLLSQKTRTAMNGKPEGLYLINTQKSDFSGWYTVRRSSLVDFADPKSLIDQQTGKKIKLYPQGNGFRF